MFIQVCHGGYFRRIHVPRNTGKPRLHIAVIKHLPSAYKHIKANRSPSWLRNYSAN